VFTQSSPTSPIRGTGADLADFLLGYPSSGDALLTIKLTDFTDYFAGYLQDDIRVSRKLTVNLGLRWEREYGIKERNNGLVTNFDETALNPLAANVTGIKPTGIVQFAGVDGQPTSIVRAKPVDPQAAVRRFPPKGLDSAPHVIDRRAPISPPRARIDRDTRHVARRDRGKHSEKLANVFREDVLRRVTLPMRAASTHLARKLSRLLLWGR
jgi:hypothetical protein